MSSGPVRCPIQRAPIASLKSYQITGPAVAVVAGVKYDFNDRWGMFGEYKGTYSMNEASLASGGTLKTNIVTNAINIGVSLSF